MRHPSSMRCSFLCGAILFHFAGIAMAQLELLAVPGQVVRDGLETGASFGQRTVSRLGGSAGRPGLPSLSLPSLPSLSLPPLPRLPDLPALPQLPPLASLLPAYRVGLNTSLKSRP